MRLGYTLKKLPILVNGKCVCVEFVENICYFLLWLGAWSIADMYKLTQNLNWMLVSFFTGLFGVYSIHKLRMQPSLTDEKVSLTS